VWHFEKLSQRVADSGFRPINLVCDLKGLGLASYYPPALWRLKMTIDLAQKRYVGVPGSCIFIVNAPAVFPVFWRLIRPWFRPHVRDMIVITGRGDYGPLHEKVEPALLPGSLGGQLRTFNLEGQQYPM
jgi:hypothetical protein